MIRRPPTALSLTKQDVEEMRKNTEQRKAQEQASKEKGGDPRGEGARGAYEAPRAADDFSISRG